MGRLRIVYVDQYSAVFSLLLGRQLLGIKGGKTTILLRNSSRHENVALPDRHILALAGNEGRAILVRQTRTRNAELRLLGGHNPCHCLLLADAEVAHIQLLIGRLGETQPRGSRPSDTVMPKSGVVTDEDGIQGLRRDRRFMNPH